MHTPKPSLLIAGLAGLALAVPATAQNRTITIAANDDVRMLTNTTNSRDDNNGGQGTGGLIGTNNPGNIDNFSLNRFPAFPIGGDVQGDAILTLDVADGFVGGGQHGSTLDTIWIRELFGTNDNWVNGVKSISGNDNQTDDGSASFLNFAQYNDDPGPASGTSVPWKDAGGADVANILGAVGPNVASAPGYDVSNGAPDVVLMIPEATMQSWLDNGLAGFLMGADDNGDLMSRFNFHSRVLQYVVPGSDADIDFDGDVDDADFGIAFAAFTGPDNGPPANPDADLDGDGDVDDADFGIAFAAFTGPNPGTVPEPTSLALLGLGGLLIARRRRA